MSFTPNILWDPHVILPPLPFFLLPPSLSPLSFPPSAFLFTLARAAAVVAVGTTVGNGGAVAMVGRRRRSSDERASSPTGATVGTRLSPDCRLERVASPRIPAASLDRSSASPSSELRALLRPDDRPPSSPWGHCRYPGSIVAVSHHVPLSANRHPLLVSSPPPAAAVLSASLLPIRCLRAPLLPTRATARLWFSSSVAGPSSRLLGGREERVR